MTDIDDRTQNTVLTSIREIRRLLGELDNARRNVAEPIAIIGMGCRMPGGGNDPDSFWTFLRNGGDAVTDFPADRGIEDGADHEGASGTGAQPAPRGAFLDGIDRFDASFFGISPREAASLDPQQRLLLEVAWESLENAGTPPDSLAGSATGVYLGIVNQDYSELQSQQVATADLDPYWATSSATTFGAGRLSYWLGLAGPSFSVNTACSSSLVAIHLAMQSLRSAECTMALAGGVNVMLLRDLFTAMNKLNFLAPDGTCRTFDRKASGYGRGEGCGIVVLKRLSDAVAAGDRIHAVIRGSAVNQDGRSSGLTVPNPQAQQAMLRSALRSAGVDAARVGYIEAHGTGTPLGDPIELRSLAAVLGDRGTAGPLRVGSVKTNIGHLEPAAGVAGLIKLVLSLQHGEIPPHLNLTELNPEIDIDEATVEIPTRVTTWPRLAEPRIGGVSSFGASGTNAHVVVEEAPQDHVRVDQDPRPQLLVYSAQSAEALAELTERYCERLAKAGENELAEICFTASTGRAHFPYRNAVVGISPAQLAQRLAEGKVHTGRMNGGLPARAVFLFSGQGTQYAGMFYGLYAGEPVFRDIIDEADSVLRPLLGEALPDILGQDALIHDTRYTQPALLAVEYALATLWMTWGIVPAAVVGHSLGELSAACVAGAMSFADGLRLAARRGQLTHDFAEPGVMAAVFSSPQTVVDAIQGLGARLSIAAVNGPENVVVSGGEDAVDAVLRTLESEGVLTKRLPGAHAFHSPLMDPLLDAFEQEAESIRYEKPRIPLVSGVTGQTLAQVTARHWRDHLRDTVQFHACMTALYDQDHTTFVEIGPGSTLLGLAKRLAPDRGEPGFRFLPSIRPRHDERTVLLESLAVLYTAGFAVKWPELIGAGARRKVTLPTYPFQRVRHWFERSVRTASPGAAPARTPRPTSLLGHKVPSPLSTLQFASLLNPDDHPCLGECVQDGLPVVNMGVYLDTAFAAARQVHGAGPIVAEGNVVLRSLIIDSATPTAVQLHLEPDGAYRYYAERSDSAEASAWLLHTQGKIWVDPQLPAPPAGVAHREEVREGLGRQLSGQDFYAQMARRGMHLGPSVRWIDHIWCGGGEAIARMRPAAPGESEPYLMHPGFGDSIFQLILACLPDETSPDVVFAVVGIDRFEFHGGQQSGPLYCHARLLPKAGSELTLIAEIQVQDGTGRVVARAEGVYAKRFEIQRAAKAGRRGSAIGAVPASMPEQPRPVTGHGLAEILAAAPEDRPIVVRDLLVRTVTSSLRLETADLDPQLPLQNFGLDSLMALEVRDALTAELGVALPVVSFLDGSGLAELGDVILRVLDKPAVAAVATQ